MGSEARPGSNSKHEREHDREALYFLCWLDTIERLDTLLLEARHLQQNIIYLLRAPDLYLPLWYEERLLWHSEGWVMLATTDLEPGELARAWILRYPTFSFAGRGIATIPDAEALEMKKHLARAKEILNRVGEAVNELTRGGRWNIDQRAYYYNLLAIQEIKRHIAYDKVSLCKMGLKLFLSPLATLSAEQQEFAFSRFLLLRTAILARARNYVARLGDHVVSFSHSQAHGLQDHPQPIVERRRDQHLYSNHLRESCRNIAIEMDMLMDHLMGASPTPRPLIFHHWQHSFTSQSYTFENEFVLEEPEPLSKRSKDTSRSPLKKAQHTSTAYQHYVNTSFWMPERLDLQTVIAHEVAHTVIRVRLNDPLAQRLELTQGPFNDLLRELQLTFAAFDVEEQTGSRFLLRELAVDLLATAIAGPAYVYALFLETVGQGLEDMFAVGVSPDQFELSMIDYLDGAAGPYAQARDWYLRLHLCCTWLEAIRPAGASSLEQRMLDACDDITERLLVFLDGKAPPECRSARYWQRLKHRLCAIVEASSAAEATKNWLNNKEPDDREQSGKEWKKGGRRLPRSTRKLHRKVRNFLFEGLRDKKRSLLVESRRIRGENTSIDVELERVLDDHFDIYALDIPKTAQGQRLTCPDLFSRLYDLPWQCAFLRGLDFVHKHSKLRPMDKEKRDGRQLLWQIHQHSALGRELYQLALEFYTHDIEPAWNRLAEAVRVVDRIAGKLPKPPKEAGPSDDPDQKLRRFLESWSGRPRKRNTKESTQELVSHLITHLSISSADILVNRYPA